VVIISYTQTEAVFSMSLSTSSGHDAEHDLSFAISAAKSALYLQLLKVE